MALPLEVTSDPRRSPCHFAPVCGTPAVVWCSVCSRTFHADAPELLIVELLAVAASGTAIDLTTPSLPRPRLRLVHDAARGDRRIP